MKPLEIGLCSWSVDRTDPLIGIHHAAELGLHAVQIGVFDGDALAKADAAVIRAAAAEADITIAGMFIGFPGVDYRSIQSIAETSGFMPDDLYDPRRELVRQAAAFSKQVGVQLLGAHIGTVPAKPSAERQKLLARVKEVADMLREDGLSLLIETGSESAVVLRDFLTETEADNLAICLDPANLLTYGSDSPPQAVGALATRLALVHIKDAVGSSQPGVLLGKQAPIGTGDADIARVISKLKVHRYGGPLLIETDTRTFGLGAIRSAADYLRSMLS